MINLIFYVCVRFRKGEDTPFIRKWSQLETQTRLIHFFFIKTHNMITLFIYVQVRVNLK